MLSCFVTVNLTYKSENESARLFRLRLVERIVIGGRLSTDPLRHGDFLRIDI